MCNGIPQLPPVAAPTVKRILAVLGAWLMSVGNVFAADRLAEHVVVIGLDGCRPEAIQQAAGPVLKKLWQSGAWTWQAQTAQPSVTQVNFAGILTSCLPAGHGIQGKDWVHGGRPKVKVPTIFEVVAGQGLKAAGFFGHEKLYPSETEVKGVHFEHSPYQAHAVAPLAARYLKEQKPDFCFIYMGDLDGAGHTHGWLSAEQLALMKNIDAALQIIVDTLRESGQWEKTLLIITADHGGHLKRSIIGAYHQVSMKHLDAYLDELEHRFNNRHNKFLFRDTLLKLVKAESLTYAELTKAA